MAGAIRYVCGQSTVLNVFWPDGAAGTGKYFRKREKKRVFLNRMS